MIFCFGEFPEILISVNSCLVIFFVRGIVFRDFVDMFLEIYPLLGRTIGGEGAVLPTASQAGRLPYHTSQRMLVRKLVTAVDLVHVLAEEQK